MQYLLRIVTFMHVVARLRKDALRDNVKGICQGTRASRFDGWDMILLTVSVVQDDGTQVVNICLNPCSSRILICTQHTPVWRPYSIATISNTSGQAPRAV